MKLKVLYTEETDSYNQEPKLGDVEQLEEHHVKELIYGILKYHKDILLDELSIKNIYPLDIIKEKSGWSVTDKDNLFITTCDRCANIYNVQKFDEKYLESYIKSNGKDVDVFKLRVFTEVSLPESIQNQITKISNKIEKEKQQKEIKKAQKRLERAKKILESNGKLT